MPLRLRLQPTRVCWIQHASSRRSPRGLFRRSLAVHVGGKSINQVQLKFCPEVNQSIKPNRRPLYTKYIHTYLYASAPSGTSPPPSTTFSTNHCRNPFNTEPPYHNKKLYSKRETFLRNILTLSTPYNLLPPILIITPYYSQIVALETILPANSTLIHPFHQCPHARHYLHQRTIPMR